MVNFLKRVIKKIVDFAILKRKVLRSGSKMEKRTITRNAKYIRFGKFVRIKAGSRIECIDSFHDTKYIPAFYLGDNVKIGYHFTALVTDKLIIGDNTI